jgi:hypothetical protein
MGLQQMAAHSVPAAAQDFGLQLIAARRPFRHVAEQAEAAVERNLAHYLAVDMVAWGASCFPQTLIRLFEVFRRERHEPFDQRAILSVEPASQRRHQMRPVGKFAADIEQALIVGIVADPHRSAAAIPSRCSRICSSSAISAPIPYMIWITAGRLLQTTFVDRPNAFASPL